MPDWVQHVRSRLELKDLEPAEAGEVVEEIGRQLEDVYQSARARGCSDSEARALCEEHIPDWDLFSRRLASETRGRRMSALGRWQQQRNDFNVAKGMPMSDLGRDLLHAVRMILKRPMFALVATLTIGLAIGASTAIFSIVNGVLLTDLPYPEPDRLVTIWEHNLPRNNLTNPVSPANFMDWRDEGEIFEAVGAISARSATLTGDHPPERVGLVLASASLLSTLELQPAVGRLFLPEEDEPGAELVTLLGYGFWQRRYGADPGIVGRKITVNGLNVEVIGVLPQGFDIPLRWDFSSGAGRDVWITLRFGENAREATGRWLQVVARLKPGVTPAACQAAMDVLAEEIKKRRPEAQAGWAINVMPLLDDVVGDTKTPILILFGAVLFVLLIACANVANLMLSRSSSRAAEMALRSALGAGRSRLVRQLLTESVLISLIGGVIGVALSVWAVRFLLGVAPAEIPRLDNVAIDWTVLAFAFGASLLTGVLFGLMPALRSTRPDLGAALKETSTRGGTGQGAARGALVVAEIALCLILLVGAGLMIRTFQGLIDTGIGFDTSRLLTFTIEADGEPAQRANFFDELVTRIEATPGVVSAGAGTFIPLADVGSATSFWVNDRPRPDAADKPTAAVRWCDTKLLQTLEVPLLAGRFFEQTDTADTGLKVIVNETLANEFWPGESPLGRTLTMPWDEDRVGEIVGVVGDVRHQGPDVAPGNKIYWHHQQFVEFDSMSIVVRTSGEPLAMADTLRRVVLDFDDTRAVYNLGTMEGYLTESVAPIRFIMILLTLFAGVALVLAAGGIYGVMSYAVTERTRELGIRLALGAHEKQVRWMVVRKGVFLVGVSLLVGGAGAVGLSRFIEGMLSDVIEANDPLTFGVVALLLSGVALLACYLPARRASQVDPLETLRYE